MELGVRLSKIASLIENCEAMADIGTDHAYIPIYLVKHEICSKAIASDINKGPVLKAKQNIQQEGLQDRIQCRIGAGLSTLKVNEVRCAVIAGMGGNLIRDIIRDDMEIFKAMDYCVLQPVQNPEVLREFLYTSGFNILDEELCFEESKYYEIIKVSYGDEPKKLEPLFYEVSQLLIEKAHPLIKEYISFKIEQQYKIVEHIQENTLNAQIKKRKVYDKIKRLKELLESCP
jgi:tRNA (adenine22-N1)-methyltransferase